MVEKSSFEERSLLVLVLDVTPAAWGERAMMSDSINAKRLAAGKPSVGPAKLVDEVLASVQTFLSAYVALNRDNGLVVIGVAGSRHVGVLYPRKTDFASALQFSANHSGGSKVDLRRLYEGLRLGVAELIGRCAASMTDNNAAATSGQASIASGISMALCLLNRFMVASGSTVGVSALRDANKQNHVENTSQDEGILAVLNSKKKDLNSFRSNKSGNFVSPRILVIQASEDKIMDYNAIMNCAFAATRANVIIDGCFVAKGQTDTSPFLEQLCDRTDGIFIKPTGRTQVGGGLTQVLMTVFLPSNLLRKKLNLPAIDKVDFRARCFETGESVEIAYVCNQCLSIFKNQPKESCHTCGAIIATEDNSSNAINHDESITHCNKRHKPS